MLGCKQYNKSICLQDTLHHIPDEVLDAPPKQCNIPSWQPSSDMPPPAKRQRTDSGSHNEAMVMAVQAKTAEGGAAHDSRLQHQTDEGANGPVVKGSSQPGAMREQNHKEGSNAHDEANELAAESNAQAQDKVLLEKGDCAAAAPVAA